MFLSISTARTFLKTSSADVLEASARSLLLDVLRQSYVHVEALTQPEVEMRLLAFLVVAHAVRVGVEAVHHTPRFDYRELVHPTNHFLGRHSGRGTSLIGVPVDDEN